MNRLVLLLTLAAVGHGLLPMTAGAGPNAGGTLILHANTSIIYTDGVTNYCGLANLDSCGAAVTSVPADPEVTTVFFTLAAFPEGSSPRLVGVTFGIQYDVGALVLVASGSCADFELKTGDWPASGSGTALTWNLAQTGLLTEVYWFAGYATYAAVTSIALHDHPTQGAYFADDGIPAALDVVSDLGTLGFQGPGTSPCPTAEPGGDSGPAPGDAPLANANQFFSIAPGNRVILNQGETSTDYIGGDVLHIAVTEGVGGINDTPLWPAGPSQQDPPPLSYLTGNFSDMPVVRSYVESHPGDSLSVWQSAVALWYTQTRECETVARHSYAASRDAGHSMRAAAADALDLVLTSPLVDTARLEQSEPLYPHIMIKWKGRSYENDLRLEPTIMLLDRYPKLRASSLDVLLQMLQAAQSGPTDVDILIENGNFGWTPKDN